MKPDNLDLNFLFQHKIEQKKSWLQPGQIIGTESGKHDESYFENRKTNLCPAKVTSAEKELKTSENCGQDADSIFDLDINDELVDLATELNLSTETGSSSGAGMLQMSDLLDEDNLMKPSEPPAVDDEDIAETEKMSSLKFTPDPAEKNEESAEKTPALEDSVQDQSEQFITEIEFGISNPVGDLNFDETTPLPPATDEEMDNPKLSQPEKGPPDDADADFKLADLAQQPQLHPDRPPATEPGEQDVIPIIPDELLSDSTFLIEAIEPAVPGENSDDLSEEPDSDSSSIKGDRPLELLSPAPEDQGETQPNCEQFIEKPDDSKSQKSSDIDLSHQHETKAETASHAQILASLQEQATESKKKQSEAKSNTSVFSEYLSKNRDKMPTGRAGRLGKDGTNRRQNNIRQAARLSGSMSFFSLFANSSLLGLDLGQRLVKYIHLKKSATGVRLVAAGSFKITKAPGRERRKKARSAAIARSLVENLNSKQIKNSLITTAVSGMEVIFKNIAVPKMARKDLKKAVPWACRKDFPFPIESTIFEFRTIAGEKNSAGVKQNVFVAAAQKELITNHLEALTSARINPAKISTIPAALWQIFQLCAGKRMINKNCGIIDLDANSSHIVFVANGQLQFAREISTGGDDFTQALAGDFFIDGKEVNLTENEAHNILCKYGLPVENDDAIILNGIELREISVLLGPVVERLINDIQRTIEFYKEKFQVNKIAEIYLSGGGALIPNLTNVLHNQLNLPVTILNPFHAISVKKHQNAEELLRQGPRFAVAAGLALDNTKELNLLPAGLKGSYFFHYLKRIFRYLFIILILLMAFFSQDVTRQFHEVHGEYNKLNLKFRQGEPRRKKFLELQQVHNALLEARRQYKKSIDVDLAAAGHLKVISNFIPPNMALTSMRLTTREQKIEGEDNAHILKNVLILDGVAFENNSMAGMNIAKFLMDLEKTNYFSVVELQSQNIRRDGSLQFTIECDL